MTNAPAKALQSFDTYFSAQKNYLSPQREITLFDKYFPSVGFYTRALMGPVWHLCRAAKIGTCDDYAWTYDSARIGRLLETVGCRFNITGYEHLLAVEEPCIIVANHMSTLETFLLPSMVRPHKPVTFVVKKSLTQTPFFKDILATRHIIAVERTNPREDLKYMLAEGKKRLEQGMSLIIFPQSTRGEFDATKFNSIGIKLAKHSGKPIIPLALKTDAWGHSKLTKDFGAITPEKTVYFAFGEAVHVRGQGKEEHAQICHFIKQHLSGWH